MADGGVGVRVASGLPVVLATPLRRLAASITDVVILGVAGFVVVGLLCGARRIDEPFGGAVGGWSTLVGWLYAWASWTWFGATGGQALWGLRVVTLRGGRLGPVRALVRCLGYALACLPARLGLLPIVRDPWRQGWHDRLAGTVVVERRALLAQGTLRLPERPPKPELKVPDLVAPLRRWWVPAAFYTVVAVVMTWPLSRCLTSRLAGWPGDPDVFYWNFWLFREAVAAGRPVGETALAFHPYTVSLAYHTMQWFDGVLAGALAGLLGPVGGYNAVILLTIVANGWAMCWAAETFTQRRDTALLAGLVLAVSPYFAVRARLHPNLLAAQFLPPVCVLAYAGAASLRLRHHLWAGVFLALCGWCDLYYLLFGAIGAVTVVAAVQWVDRRRAMAVVLRRLGLLAGLFLTALLLLAPLIVAMARERATSGYMNVKVSEREEHRLDLVDVLSPSPLHPLSAPAEGALQVERLVTPGITILVLAVFGFAGGALAMRVWLGLALTAVVLACGSTLRVGGAEDYPSLMLRLLAGLPGNGFAHPWSPHGMGEWALHVLALPELALSYREPIGQLPLAWLLQWLPVLHPLKSPARLMVLFLVAVAVLAAAGAGALCDRLADRLSVRRRTVILLLIGLTLFEYAAWPFPTTDVSVHPFYHRLAADPRPMAIVEAPLHSCFSQYQLYQTVHGKALFMVNLARVPRSAVELLRRNAVLRALSASPSGRDDEPLVKLRLDDWPAEEVDSPRCIAALAIGLAQLRALGCGYLVIHKPLLYAWSVRRVRAVLSGRLGLPLVVDDEELLVYALDVSSR